MQPAAAVLEASGVVPAAAGGAARRTLGFCCSIAHADFMAGFFRERGVPAVAVHSGGSSSDRVESLEQFAGGSLPVLSTVDLFNEGVDVPATDVVMMLRPTESAVVFLQQLGRGLRKADGKDRLEVIDLVGEAVATPPQGPDSSRRG